MSTLNDVVIAFDGIGNAAEATSKKMNLALAAVVSGIAAAVHAAGMASEGASGPASGASGGGGQTNTGGMGAAGTGDLGHALATYTGGRP